LHGWSLVPCSADVMIKVCYWTLDHGHGLNKCIAYLYIQDSGKLNFGNSRNKLKLSSIW
jgi:hypothetical protein